MRVEVKTYIKRAYQPKQELFQGELVTVKTDDEIIGEQLAKSKIEDKELELLAKQLRLPENKRSKEILRKYNLDIVKDNSTIENYATEPGMVGNYEVYFPEDVSVKPYRPSNQQIAAIENVVDSNGNQFSFYFHVSVAKSTLENINFKIDGFETYLDKDFNLLNKGEFDLYKALYTYKTKDESYKDKIIEVFHKYNIMSKDSNVLFEPGEQVDLKIKGLGLRVVNKELNHVPVFIEAPEPVVIEEPVIEIPDVKSEDNLKNEEELVNSELSKADDLSVKKKIEDISAKVNKIKGQITREEQKKSGAFQVYYASGSVRRQKGINPKPKLTMVWCGSTRRGRSKELVLIDMKNYGVLVRTDAHSNEEWEEFRRLIYQNNADIINKDKISLEESPILSHKLSEFEN